jgi:hypothetical protein
MPAIECFAGQWLWGFSQRSDEDISIAVVAYFRNTLPSADKKGTCELSASLDRVLQSRDKVHAHNEAVPKSSRDLPSWKDTRELFEYGRSFVSTISAGFLGIALIATEPWRTSRLLDLLIAVSNLATEDFINDPRNEEVVQRLRNELGLEE